MDRRALDAYRCRIMMWLIAAGVCFAVLVYTWAGYPLLLILLAGIIGRHTRSALVEPTVSLIVTAFNEERVIKDKIENCLRLDYPAAKLEIIIGSDGSTDHTNEIVTQCATYVPNIRLVAHAENRGKSQIQNDAARSATGDILVFSDATGFYEHDALRALVGGFADPSVGCVAGAVLDRARNWTPVNEANLTYFAYDNLLRKKEGELGILHGISGSIFAVRRELYVPLRMLQADDLDTPLNVIRRGFRVVWEPEAISRDEVAGTVRGKFRQKMRVVIRSLTTILLHQRDLLNPLRHPLVAVSIVSHRLLRYAMPFVLAAFLVASVALWRQGTAVGGILISAEAAIAGAATLGGVLYVARRAVTILTVPFYFCLLNAAVAAGTIAFLAGVRRARWPTDR